MRVLVAGDWLSDVWIYVSIERKAAEGCDVWDIERTKITEGGAGNVYKNIKALAPKAWVVTSSCVSSTQPFLQKTRYVDSKTNQILARCDNGKKYRHPINGEGNLSTFDLVVIADYNKNTLSDQFYGAVFGSGVKCLVDSKRLPKWFRSENIIVKCNEQEWRNTKDADVVTLGERGYMIPKQYLDTVFPASHKTKAVDIIGAGDCFISAMAAYFINSHDWNLKKMCEYGNKAAGIRVQRFGKPVVSEIEMKEIEV